MVRTFHCEIGLSLSIYFLLIRPEYLHIKWRNIFTLIMNVYGTLEESIQFISDNNIIINSLNSDISMLAGRVVEYNPALVVTLVGLTCLGENRLRFLNAFMILVYFINYFIFDLLTLPHFFMYFRITFSAAGFFASLSG